MKVPPWIHTVLSKSTQVPIFSDVSTSTTGIDEISSFQLPVSSKEPIQVPDCSATSSSQDVIQLPSRIHTLSVSKSEQSLGLSQLSLLTLSTKEIMPSPGPFSCRESMQVPHVSDTRLPQEPMQTPSAILAMSHIPNVSDPSTSTIFKEEISSFPSLVPSKTFIQVPDSTAKISSQNTMQVPPWIHTILLSKSTQVPIFSDPSISTTCIDEISSFPVLVTSKEPIQYPDCSPTISLKDAMEIPSNIHTLSVSKSTQISGLSHLSSSTVCMEEILSFPGPFSSRKSMQVPELSDINLLRGIVQVPSTHYSLAMNKSTQIPSFSDPSLSAVSTEDISSFSVPASSRASMQSPHVSFPRDTVQIPSTSPAVSICKSTQNPSLSSQNSSTICIGVPVVSSKEVLQLRDFADTCSPIENEQVPCNSGAISIRKSTQVPSFYSTSSSSIDIGDVPSFIVQVSSKESKLFPGSSDIISTKLKQALTSNAFSVNKSSQVSSPLVLYTSNKSIQFPSSLSLISLSQSVQVPSISSTSSASESTGVPSLAELSEELPTLNRGISLSKHEKISSFSGTVISREHTGVSSLSVQHSVQESVETHFVSGSTLTKENVQSVTPSQSNEFKQALLLSSLKSLSKAIQFPSSSDTRNESIQSLDVSKPKSVQESLDFSIISESSLARESLEFPPVPTLTSSKDAEEGLQSSRVMSPIEITKKKNIQSDIPISPRKSEQDPSGLNLPSQSLHLSPSLGTRDLSMENSWRESTEGPDVSDSKSLQESLDISNISEPGSTKEFSEIPPLSISPSSQGIAGFPSSTLRSPEEITEEQSVQSDAPNSSRQSKQAFPPYSNISLNTINKRILKSSSSFHFNFNNSSI
ncbi:serine-rich adhesin for platelets-like [Petaurus breviceps papuanus]|uniref:serine-rich adhesin for platelets-like n=1 Tax=Petaurus breviceps papuanus TaxID=3040969 RepID=UPI0036D9F112